MHKLSPVTIDLPEFGGDLARRVRAIVPRVIIRKDRTLGRGGPLMRVVSASPEEISALRARFPELRRDAIEDRTGAAPALTPPPTRLGA